MASTSTTNELVEAIIKFTRLSTHFLIPFLKTDSIERDISEHLTDFGVDLTRFRVLGLLIPNPYFH